MIIIKFKLFIICLIKFINKCRAIIFALNRKTNVKGRIMFLTLSIITINGIKMVFLEELNE